MIKKLLRKARYDFFSMRDLHKELLSLKTEADLFPAEETFFPSEVKSLYHVNCGPDASLSFFPSTCDIRRALNKHIRAAEFAGKFPEYLPGISVSFALAGNDYRRNWAELCLQRFSAPILTETMGFAFFLRSEGSGGVLRLILEAADGSEWVSEHRLALRTRH
ncbi:MAG: hypothetical protein PHW04_17755, partial [Candidatus Wallbacteria bacterium]|nr:hypothetical protein [Candidatus Wallbacteria bacterium]